MMTTNLIVAMLIAAPAAPAADGHQQRLCNLGARGSVQIAYRPYASPVYGSDGLTCATVKDDPEQVRLRRERPARPQSSRQRG
jgi:hypothetical protein